MRRRIVYALALVIITAATMLEAQGKPASVPVGTPATPVQKPATPPENPPSSLIDFVCSILPVPYLCD